MADNDYKTILLQAMDEWIELESKRQEIELELEQKLQFIRATFNMLSEEDKPVFAELVSSFSLQPGGITLAVRRILQDNAGEWFTATLMRDKLAETGFDFSNYKANPLASVHAVLKRCKPEETESVKMDGVMAWRWRADIPKRFPRIMSAKGRAFIGRTSSAAPNVNTKGWLTKMLEAQQKEKDRQE